MTKRSPALPVFVATVLVSAPLLAQTPPLPSPLPPGAEQAPAPVPMPQAPAPVPMYPPPGYAPPPGYSAPVYPPPGYAQPGYPPQGYPTQGYPTPGYYAPGYPPAGYLPPRAARPPAMNPDDPPPGYHTESRSRSSFVVAGGVMFGISYVLSLTAAISAVSANDSGYQPLFIPVVGPFVAMGSTHVFVGTSDAAQQVGRVFGAIGLVFDGLLQVSGASLLVVGLAVRKDVVVRDPPPGTPEVSFGAHGATALWKF